MSSTDVTANFTTARLDELQMQGVARAVASKASAARRLVDHVTARIENRMIEFVLLSRLRAAHKVAHSETNARQMIAAFRGAYESGRMETLPSFLPSPLAPAGRQGELATFADSATLPAPDLRPKLLYTVGGGFIMPPSRRQKIMVQRLADTIGCEVALGRHRMAPEHPFPAAIDDIVEQFLSLSDPDRPQGIPFMAADTAGASIVLGAVQTLRANGQPLPPGIILFCPWCDLSLSGWSYITRSMTTDSPFRMETAAFCARLYLQEQNPTDPLASAIYADLAGLPPILIHTSRHDLHFDDALRIAEKGAQVGCDVRLNYWDSPRHHMERLATADAAHSFRLARQFIDELWPD